MKELPLVGLSISKQFINSVANIIGTDLSNYKVIRQNQFACSLMQVSRDEKIPIAMYRDEKAIMSPAYPIFKVIDPLELLPEYLMMWFSRTEFDRQASYFAVGGVRGNLPWEDFLDLEVPIPQIEKQREIVKEYQAIENRIALNQQLIQKLEETAHAIYREWFVEGIDRENLPEGWRVGPLSELCEYSTRRVSINEISLETYISTENMLQDRAGISIANGLPTTNSVTGFENGNILISNIRPYFKKIWLANFSGGCSNDVLCFVPTPAIPSLYLYQIIEKDNFFEYVMAGSKGTKMPRGDKKWIMNFETIIPSDELLERFSITSKKLQNEIQLRKKENQNLNELKDLLLSRLATIEN
ncbi:Type I restriction-modification system, specificity subunit S [Mariniradius saccharolyticus AK6]|uniref:Type I restriction-modification system, specificity subunit S n=1 Tax=Mariniradius saccharolyticus AK6 TaxID=1239962 RepID=M7X9E7_9BACT|nr:Type I restriction-modification system, specificity subunit S [Mariniradius saccharolyticus AK6]